MLRNQFAADDSVIVRQQPEKKIPKESTVYFFAVLLMSLAGAVRIDWMIEGGTPTGMIPDRSTLVSEHLFYWKQGPNGTDPRAELRKQYGMEISTTSVAMGVWGIGMIFVNNLQEHLVRDILLMTALHSHRMTQIFHSSILKTLRDATNVDEIIQRMREIHDRFVEISNDMEFGFGKFFMVIHVQNWLFCSYFLFDILLGDTDDVYFVESASIIPKILLTYFIASKASAAAHAARNAIERHNDRKVSNAIEKLKVKTFLKTLKRNPIGIGRGKFQMDDSFAWNFVCIVISCLLLFVDTAEKNK